MKENTALVITDPQNDFLSPDGATWGMVGDSVTANNTVENIESLFKVAKEYDVPVFISPHYYYPRTTLSIPRFLSCSTRSLVSGP